MCAKHRAPLFSRAHLTEATGLRQALSMTRLLAAFVALFVAACAAPGGTPAEAPHRHWHITLVAPGDMREQVAAAGEEWNAALGRHVFVMGTGSEAYGLKGHVYVRWSSYEEMGGSGGWTLSERGHHFDVLLTANMNGKRVAFEHELGHVLGAEDTQVPGDVMNGDLTPEGASLSDANVEAVYAFWGWDEQERPLSD